jgi:hypothetical protein
MVSATQWVSVTAPLVTMGNSVPALAPPRTSAAVCRGSAQREDRVATASVVASVATLALLANWSARVVPPPHVTNAVTV